MVEEQMAAAVDEGGGLTPTCDGGGWGAGGGLPDPGIDECVGGEPLSTGDSENPGLTINENGRLLST